MMRKSLPSHWTGPKNKPEIRILEYRGKMPYSIFKNLIGYYQYEHLFTQVYRKPDELFEMNLAFIHQDEEQKNVTVFTGKLNIPGKPIGIVLEGPGNIDYVQNQITGITGDSMNYSTVKKGRTIDSII